MDTLFSNNRSHNAMPAAYTDLSALQKIKSEGDKDVALHKVAKQFESMFVGLLFKGMRQANEAFEDDAVGHTNAENTYRDMYDQQMSMNISSGRGVGIADMVYKQLKGSHRTQHVAENLDESNMRIPDKESPTARGVEAIKIVKPKTLYIPSKQNKPSDIKQNLFSDSPLEFTRQLLPFVKKGAEALGLDPLIVVAQAALETGWGKHIVKDSTGNSSLNLFNIKADSRWSGSSVNTHTLEFRDGITVKENAKFRQYHSIAESVDDYLDFVKNNPRYENALNLTGDPHDFIDELHNAGYATDPQYAEKVKAVYKKINAELTEG